MPHKILRLVRWLQRLFGLHRKRNQALPLTAQQPPPPLTDIDLDFLFIQLLEGVYQGKSQAWVQEWLLSLENRVTSTYWVAWLHRFGKKLLASPSPNTELAARMVQLGEIGCGEIGEVAYKIGMQLLTRKSDKLSGKQKKIAINLTKVAQPQTQKTPLESEIAAMIQEDVWEDNEVFMPVSAPLSVDTKVTIVALTEQFTDIEQLTKSQPIALLQPAVKPYFSQEFQGFDYPEVWNNQGVALKNLGDLEQALTSFEKAISIRSGYYQAWYNRGVVLFEKALQTKFDAHQSCENLGGALFNVGCLNEALLSFNKALEIKPDYEQAQNSRDQIMAYYERTCVAFNKGKSPEYAIN